MNIDSFARKDGIVILVVSDNESDISEIRNYADKTMSASYVIQHCDSLVQASDFFSEDTISVDIVLIDLGLGGTKDPYANLLCMQKIGGDVPIIVLTESGDHALALRAIRDGAADNITREKLQNDQYKLRDAIEFSLARNSISRISARKSASALKNLGEQGAADIEGMKVHEENARKEARTEAGIVLREAVDHGNQTLKEASKTAAKTLKAATEYGEKNLKEAKAEAVETLREAGEESAGRQKELELISQVKSEFLANMSHELRTPLNSIIGLTRMLFEEKDLADEHREMVGIAYRSANNLLDIVNDILDLSKVEAGMLILEHITFSL